MILNFFSLANKKAAYKLKYVFGMYESVSGQALNLNKSSTNFGSKVSAEVKTRMCNILGLHNVGEIGKYLGLHEHFRNNTSDMVTYITYKVKAITQGWNQRYMYSPWRQGNSC